MIHLCFIKLNTNTMVQSQFPYNKCMHLDTLAYQDKQTETLHKGYDKLKTRNNKRAFDYKKKIKSQR